MARDGESEPVGERLESGAEPVAAPDARPARRRFLKHGLAGGSVALLVAGKPVKTLAKTYCKMSGWNSLKVSKKKKGGGVTLSHAPATCSVKVHPPSYYYTKKKKSGQTRYSTNHWPTTFYNYSGINSSTTFNQLFGGNNSNGITSGSALSILHTYPTSVYAYMISVAFASTGAGFPLSQQYVYDLWMTYGSSGDQASLLTFLTQLGV